MNIFKRLWAPGLLTLLLAFLLTAPQAQARPGDRVSFQTFYEELEPYGRWINDQEYGYVWSPDVERGFQPYATRGHWVMTEYGNTWVSDYDWGWAPFHYGRWIYDDYDGWLWIPGHEWGPAWVDWRHNNGYYGWAPMGPRSHYYLPASRWVFVPVRYITHPRIYTYCVPRTQVVNIYHNTTIINNYYERGSRKYVYGPRNQDIERATNRKVNVYRVENDSRAGRTAVAENSVRIYRPEVDNRRSEAPARVENRSSNSLRSRSGDSNVSSSRTDRSSGTRGYGAARNRSAVESQSGVTTGAGNSAAVGRSQAGTALEQRSPDTGRERSSVRRTSPRSSNIIQSEGSTRDDFPTRTRESESPESRATRSRSADEQSPAPRSERSPVTHSSESAAQRQYQSRSRQVPAATPAPRQEQPQTQLRSEGSSESPAREHRRPRN